LQTQVKASHLVTRHSSSEPRSYSRWNTTAVC